MKLGSKIAIGFLLGIGVPIILLGCIGALNSKEAPTERVYAFIGGLMVGLPPTALGSWLLWSSHRRYQQEERDRLRSAFYRLLQENSGNLTVLRFSMETGLDGQAAKAYLDSCAQEFNATYNVTEEGNISYYFNLDGSQELGSGH